MSVTPTPTPSPEGGTPPAVDYSDVVDAVNALHETVQSFGLVAVVLAGVALLLLGFIAIGHLR